jgi:hypothetical protein
MPRFPITIGTLGGGEAVDPGATIENGITLLAILAVA